ncbi:ribosome biogenesis GTP-binding protein YihA/YsxC [Desulfopila inferna]|uniref:ribosome biogenesis GTP-binding protein YihA/YsxC n=1 Tax=Desulfopila inferna TaxID=468528 RepID=UPI001964CE6D|nr:ribosome biogenesis GTP-binding protein YihA/YsxC [Desulfopila inferna]MBM9602950.1 YihA family ribosome biogenesis GTP-binding protein [Desulfopila inferna]
MIYYHETEFLLSAHSLTQLPPPDLPEFAFAGRSNVGKSSLLNRLFGRKSYVKVSSTPGKTQGLNFFLIDGQVYMVDLPGYGFAKVSKSMQSSWGKLIAQYLEQRNSLRCVVVIIDLRHPPKNHDRQLLDWLRTEGIACLAVYTKADKLSGNQRSRNAALLDAGLGISATERILFSAKSGLGTDALKDALAAFLTEDPVSSPDDSPHS